MSSLLEGLAGNLCSAATAMRVLREAGAERVPAEDNAPHRGLGEAEVLSGEADLAPLENLMSVMGCIAAACSSQMTKGPTVESRLTAAAFADGRYVPAG